MLSTNFFVMAFYLVGDGMCVIFGSILRGCGLQVMAAKVRSNLAEPARMHRLDCLLLLSPLWGPPNCDIAL